VHRSLRAHIYAYALRVTASVALFFLYQTLGSSVFAGFVVMIALLPINAWSAMKSKKAAQEQMKAKDRRIKVMDEVLAGIKVIKLYAWEQSFMNKVQLSRTRAPADTGHGPNTPPLRVRCLRFSQVIGIRKEELAALRRGFMYGSIGSIAWIAAPILVALSSFTFYTVGACDSGRGGCFVVRGELTPPVSAGSFLVFGTGHSARAAADIRQGVREPRSLQHPPVPAGHVPASDHISHRGAVGVRYPTICRRPSPDVISPRALILRPASPALLSAVCTTF